MFTLLEKKWDTEESEWRETVMVCKRETDGIVVKEKKKKKKSKSKKRES